MNKIIISLITVLGIASSVYAYPWETQKSDAKKFFVNLGGVAPTAGNFTTNFVEPGDIIIDSYNDSLYIVTSKAGGKYVKIASNGLVSVTGGASTTQVVMATSTLTPQTVSLTDTNGVTAACVTGITQTVTYKTNVVSAGIWTTAP